MIFLDSSFLISFEVANDSNHERAVSIMRNVVKGVYGTAVISNFIFDETVTVTFARTNLSNAISAGEGMKASYAMEIVEEKIFNDAWDLFKNQKNTELSFIDCTSVILLQERGIKNIATFDQDFKKIKGINAIS